MVCARRMVEVRYRGRFGNRLFQYCFGRILAEELGFALCADSIRGFPGTAETVSGQAHDHPVVVLEHHVVDLPAVVRDRRARRVVVDGFFQRYEYYRSYRDRIRSEWLRRDDEPRSEVGAGDLTMHVRLGDYVTAHGAALPFSYYESILRRTRYDRLILCSDDPDDPFLRRFAPYQPIIRRAAELDDFRLLRAARKIVLSQSSFSWWAAFLSEAEEIYFPLPATGFWGEDRPDIDLRVDEPRYIYVDCAEMDRPTPRERIVRFFNRVRRRLARRIGFG